MFTNKKESEVPKPPYAPRSDNTVPKPPSKTIPLPKVFDKPLVGGLFLLALAVLLAATLVMLNST